MAAKKTHMVEVFVQGDRYIASELNGVITVNRGGVTLGKARWHNDQMVDSTATLPDEVVETLEKRIKERMDVHWDED